jgi:hypothetical protein
VDAAAAAGSRPVTIETRVLKGAALIRMTWETEAGAADAIAADADVRLRRSALRELVDAAGGSMLMEMRDARFGIAIRLALAGVADGERAAQTRLGAA